MERPARIHVFGASGSGTTTLGATLANQLGILHLDVDDFYWKKTAIPFEKKNSPENRLRAIRKVIGESEEWILSGSIVSWGGPLLSKFTLAIFVQLDPAMRMEMLRSREIERYGQRIEPSGDLRQAHLDFMEWARRYDEETSGIRCLPVHMAWMEELPCKSITVNSARSVEEVVSEVLANAD